MTQKLARKLGASVASMGLLLSSVAPAFAQLESTITGNGAGSTNMVEQNTTNSNEIYQNNTAVVSNKLKIVSSTGGNEMSGNTGGNATVETGDTTVAATISNTVNTNQAIVDNCNCAQAVETKIEGNGSGSYNAIDQNQTNLATISQTGKAEVTNDLTIKANTGKNDIQGLTGGTATVKTGNVTIAPVDIINTVNTNIAIVGAPGSETPAPTMNLNVGGNGSDSVNILGVSNTHLTGFFQTGESTVLNDLQIEGNTGKNDVEDNTMSTDPGSAVVVETGHVIMDVYVDTATGFNIASDDCGCIQDVAAAVNGNGTEAYSDVLLNMVTDSTAYQQNSDVFATEGEIGCGTGYNDLNDNTNGGTMANTGNCQTDFQDINTGSSNFFGKIAELPTISSVNVAAFLGALGVSIETP